MTISYYFNIHYILLVNDFKCVQTWQFNFIIFSDNISLFYHTLYSISQCLLTTNYSEVTGYILVDFNTEDRTVTTRSAETPSTDLSPVITSSTDSPSDITANQNNGKITNYGIIVIW